MNYSIPLYAKYPITVAKGKGSYIWDSKGKKYLDFYGGHAVCILGHCHPKVVKAIQKQAETLIFYSNVFYIKPAEELAEKLAKTLSPEKYQVYFTNSGSEANEAAIKIARKHTGKNHIISFKNSFHGRSTTSLGVTGIDSYQRFNPKLSKHTSFAELGNIDSVKKAYTKETAAVICESIQSIGGINMAPKTFYKELAKFCKTKGILLIFDEVQTGIGRTGENFWFAQTLGVSPDIITSAKGIASGVPLSAVIAKKSIAEKIEMFDHATTFGGGPIPCAAGVAVIDTILKPGFLKGVRGKSALLKAKIAKLPQVKKVLGEGLLLGIEFEKEVPNLVKNCLKKGLIIGPSSKKNVYRITPPLNISKKEINEFMKIFKTTLNK